MKPDRVVFLAGESHWKTQTSALKLKRPKLWAVTDAHYLEVSLAEFTTRHLQIEFDEGVRIILANGR